MSCAAAAGVDDVIPVDECKRDIVQGPEATIRLLVRLFFIIYMMTVNLKVSENPPCVNPLTHY